MIPRLSDLRESTMNEESIAYSLPIILNPCPLHIQNGRIPGQKNREDTIALERNSRNAVGFGTGNSFMHYR